jgi:hypothetical protein
MSLEDFLRQKRIASDAFRAAQPAEWAEYERLLRELGPISFDYQKKFFFNGLRREFPLLPEAPAAAEASPAPERKKLILKRPAAPVPEAEAAEAPAAAEVSPAPERKKLILKRPAAPAPEAEAAEAPAAAEASPAPERKKLILKRPAAPAPEAEAAEAPPAPPVKKPLPLRTVIKEPEPPQASGEEPSPNHAEDSL